MQIADKTYRRFSFEQYLNLLEDTGFRFEFNDGLIIPVNYGRPIDSLDLEYLAVVMAKSVGSRAHRRIVSNLANILHRLVDRDRFVVYTEGQCVYLMHDNKQTFPDVVVTREGQEKYDEAETDGLLNPILLVEVLSKSTQSNDKTWKWAGYQGIDSLREYLMVAQNEPKVEQYVRKSDPFDWDYTVYEGLGKNIHLPSLEVELVTSGIYKKVDFSSEK